VIPPLKPQIPKGFRDFLPQQKALRQKVIKTIQQTFELFGYEPLETPALEYASLLEGKYGEEGEKLIYKFTDRGGRDVALRYDLTIPLSRVMAMYPELPKPFKCYQISPVWRADKPQRGRFREFWQCDADIVGSDSVLADAEIIATVHHILKALNFTTFTIHINNRKILNGIARELGIAEHAIPSLLRIIDKMEHKGIDGVKEEMREKGFSEIIVNVILELYDNTNDSSRNFSYLRNRYPHSRPLSDGIKELEDIFSCLASLNIGEGSYRFDLSLARGLDYYTGPIFETTVDEPRIGSISGGGRYDNLIGMFNSAPLPATGSSFGLERILTVLEELNLSAAGGSASQILVALFSPETEHEALSLLSLLRSSAIKAEIYLKHDKMKKQLAYASSRKIPLVAILGPDEIRQGTVVLRDMSRGEQMTVSRTELIPAIHKELHHS
jgi:histidyl-tRNA synthetase